MGFKRENIDLAFTEPHYSTRILKAFINYFEETRGTVYVEELFFKAGIDLDYAKDEENWVSEAFFDRLFDLIDQDRDIPRDWGYRIQRSSNDPKYLTTLHRAIAFFFPIRRLYLHVAGLTRNFNKVDAFGFKEMGRDHFEARFQSRRKTRHIQQIVEGWRGYLETIPFLVKEMPATVNLTREQDEYVFSIRVNRSKSRKFLKVFTTLHFVFFFVVFCLMIFNSLPQVSQLETIFYILVVSISCNIILLIRKMFASHEKTIEGLLHTNRAYEKRYIDLFESRKNVQLKNVHAQVLRKVSTFALKTRKLSRLLRFALNQAIKNLTFSRSLIMLIDQNGEKMIVAAASGFTKAFHQKLLPYIQMDMRHQKKDPHLFHNLVFSNEPIVIEDVDEYKQKLEPQNRDFLELLEVEQFIVVPLFEGQKRYGLLVMDRARREGVLVEDDVPTAYSLANQLSISIGHFYTQDSLARTQQDLRQSLETTQKIAHFVPKQLKRSIDRTSWNDLYKAHNLSTSTVAFVDIAGYATMSEKFTPDDNVEFLNKVFMSLDPIVERFDGDIDKRIGDSMMIVFPMDEHVVWERRSSWRAIQCLWEIKHTLDRLRFDSPSLCIKRVNYHIGAATGPLIHANIGSPLRLEHTVLGDTVNVASRLERVSKNNTIVVNEHLFEEIKDQVVAQKIGNVSLKSKAIPINIYEIQVVKERTEDKVSGNGWRKLSN